MELKVHKKRFSERWKWKKVAVPAAVALLSCVVLFLLFLVLMKTEYFNLAKVDIKGLKVLDETDVRMLTDPYIGKSIFSDEMVMLEKRLEDMTWIRDAVIKPKLFDRIEIQVTEREPVALIVTRDGSVYRTFSIDADGYLVAEGSRLLVVDLPVITGLEMQKLYIGETVKFKELNELLLMLQKMRQEDSSLYKALNEINMVNSYGLIRYTFHVSDWNIPVSTIDLDPAVLHRVRLLLSSGHPETIRRISAYSNMLFVEEKRGNNNG